MKTTIVNFSYFEISIRMGEMTHILVNRQLRLFSWKVPETFQKNNLGRQLGMSVCLSVPIPVEISK